MSGVPVPAIPEVEFMKYIKDKITPDMAPLKVAVVHPVDESSIKGAFESAAAGLITPILVGPETKIRDAAQKAGIDITSFQIVPTDHSHAAADMAVKLVKEGKAEAIMKGAISTDELLHPVVAKEAGLRTAHRMTHVFITHDAGYHKPLFITDAAINITPDLKTKIDIVQNAVDFFWRLEGKEPKVAILTATEKIQEDMPATTDAAILRSMSERKQIRGAKVDGPMALDIAMSKEAAKIKKVFSEVAGDPDILVFPEIQSGNIFYKSRAFMSGAQSGGIVLGAKIPIILTSRSDSVEARITSSAMALLYARGTPRPE